METYWCGLRSGLGEPSIRHNKRRPPASTRKTPPAEPPPVTGLTLTRALDPSTAAIAARAVSRCAVDNAARGSLFMVSPTAATTSALTALPISTIGGWEWGATPGHQAPRAENPARHIVPCVGMRAV